MKIAHLAFALLLLSAASARADGFDETYKAYIGDLDGDGRKDIYFKWKPNLTIVSLDDQTIPIVTRPRGASDFVLKQTTSGGFSVSAVSGALLSVVSQWPELGATVFRLIEDYNADGFMDMALRNLSTAIPGAVDQIIYASPSRNALPAQARVIDAGLLKFAREAYGWVTNANYFKNNARRISSANGRFTTYLGYIYEAYPPYAAADCAFYDTCEYAYGNINNPSADPNNADTIQNVWHWYGVQIVTGGTRLDYSVFDPRSMQLAGVLTRVIDGKEPLVPGGEIESAIKSIMASVLGTPIYGGALNSGTSYVDDEDIQTDRLRALLQLFLSLGSMQAQAGTGPFTNPLLGAWINKANNTGQYNCTADGRFGNFRPGGHRGVDLGSSSAVPVMVGTNVVAAADGTAVPGTGKGHGTLVELYYPGYIFRYSHLSSTSARARVTGGTVVGQVGKTGNAAAACIKPHLHFEVGNTTTGLVDPSSVSNVFTWALEP